MPRKPRGLGIYAVILLAAVFMLFLYSNLFTDTTPTLNYSTIIGYIQQGRVEEFTLDLGSGDLVMYLREEAEEGEGEAATDGESGEDATDPSAGDSAEGEQGVEEEPEPQADTQGMGLWGGLVDSQVPQETREIVRYRVPNVSLFLRDTEDYLKEYNERNPDEPILFDYKKAQEIPYWITFIPSLLLVGALIFFWFYMMRQSRGSGGNVSGFGKAKAKSGQDGRKVTFADVAGADEEKEELVEVVEFLKSPGKFNTLGARIPKGVLLVGPPGTGKTLMARAVAGEAGVQFFSISGSDFVEMFVGVGASRVRDLFEQAKKNAPSVVFIDEIDAVGRQRGAGLGGGHDEREQTLNQLLVEMDGFSANTGVIIIAATNRRDILDPALLRPGRFDRQIVVNYPDIKGREDILKVHARNKPMGPDVNLKTIAKTTAGFTGADLENLLNESALLAARKSLKAITMPEIEEASIKVQLGPEKKSKVVTVKKKILTAYHEAGHALCYHYCPTQGPVHQISIIPRGPAGGYTMQLPSEDHYMMRTKTQMYEDIVVAMGGRVAEQLVLDDISTGASGDLRQATDVARDMVTKYGFSESVGPVVYGQDQGEVFLGRDYTHGRDYSEEVASVIDTEVRNLMENAYQQATDLISTHMGDLHRLSAYLFEHEKMDGQEFLDLLAGKLNPEKLLDVDKEFGGKDGKDTPAPAAVPDPVSTDEKSEIPPPAPPQNRREPGEDDLGRDIINPYPSVSDLVRPDQEDNPGQ